LDGTEYDAVTGQQQVQGPLSPTPVIVYVGSLSLQGTYNQQGFVVTKDPADGLTTGLYLPEQGYCGN
jgi:hypothetical protein